MGSVVLASIRDWFDCQDRGSSDIDPTVDGIIAGIARLGHDRNWRRPVRGDGCLPSVSGFCGGEVGGIDLYRVGFTFCHVIL